MAFLYGVVSGQAGCPDPGGREPGKDKLTFTDICGYLETFADYFQVKGTFPVLSEDSRQNFHYGRFRPLSGRFARILGKDEGRTFRAGAAAWTMDE